ncbi:hypothetical protein DZB84_13340 [Bacillus sp. HNG]|uniref:hypothetical protein n=1 Tax=Bacillus sp. HNG TaxID=2293325 RepID=UPI000E2E8174|nr:hypothetical protein [Bacillus sp. HNG]RFB15382.1 hypothetical protein DZB84_13340 [Bacillus sp. HNG]
MNRTQLIKIGQYLGIQVTTNNRFLMEAKPPYEDYIQLENNVGSYEYSEINFERRPSPQKENIVAFNHETTATKYFLIKLLKKFYFKDIFPADNPVHTFNNINELLSFFQKLGVPNSFYHFHNINPQTIHYEIDSNNRMRISYVNRNNQKTLTTMPLSIDKGIFVMYRLTYSLFLIKELEQKFSEKDLLDEKFDDEDIELFLE